MTIRHYAERGVATIRHYAESVEWLYNIMRNELNSNTEQCGTRCSEHALLFTTSRMVMRHYIYRERKDIQNCASMNFGGMKSALQNGM